MLNNDLLQFIVDEQIQKKIEYFKNYIVIVYKRDDHSLIKINMPEKFIDNKNL